MYNEETNPVVATQQASTGLAADLLRTAERELAAFYTAVVRRYGPGEARRAAYDWIEEMETMDWPLDQTVPNWRRVSIVTADCVASRVIAHSLNL